MNATIRPLSESTDMRTVQQIYAHHVLYGSSSFELQAPNTETLAGRLLPLQQDGYPVLVLEAEQQIQGYAYAGPYRPREGYRFTADDSIYLRPEAQGQGYGKALLRALIGECQKAKLRRIMAVIGDSENTSSIALHQRCGFWHIGTAKGIGFKFGRWLDVVYMQYDIATDDAAVDAMPL